MGIGRFKRILQVAVLAWVCMPCDIFAQTAVESSVSAQEKGIAVLEPRPFGKSGRGEISIGLGTIASDIFLVYLPVTLRGAYHFREWVSLELSASYMGCFSNETGDGQLRASGQKCMRVTTSGYNRLTGSASELTQLRNVTIREYEVGRLALNPVFSPLMGKFSLGGQYTGHFDLNLTAGIGVQWMERPDAASPGLMHNEVSFEGSFGLGLRMVFLDFVGVRLDFREYLFGHAQIGGLGTASELTLSVSFLFPGRRTP